MLVNTVALEKAVTHSCSSGKHKWKRFISPVLPLMWSRTTVSQTGQSHCLLILFLLQVFWDCYSTDFFLLFTEEEKWNIPKSTKSTALALELQVINHTFQTCLWELSILTYCNLHVLGNLRKHCRHNQFPSRTGQQEYRKPHFRAVNLRFKSTQVPMTAVSSMPLSSGLVTGSPTASVNSCCMACH